MNMLLQLSRPRALVQSRPSSADRGAEEVDVGEVERDEEHGEEDGADDGEFDHDGAATVPAEAGEGLAGCSGPRRMEKRQACLPLRDGR
jgi:hypothetical protein